MITISGGGIGDGGVKPVYNMAYVWTISLVAAMGGLLFGYDWVVIGGAAKFYEAQSSRLWSSRLARRVRKVY
jgi:hypothetical protein